MHIIKASGLFFFCLVLFAGTRITVWLRIWNPDTLLHQPLPIYQLSERHITKAPGTAPRDYHVITLANADGGTVHFTVSLPHGTEALIKGDGLTVRVVLTRFRTGQNFLRKFQITVATLSPRMTTPIIERAENRQWCRGHLDRAPRRVSVAKRSLRADRLGAPPTLNQHRPCQPRRGQP